MWSRPTVGRESIEGDVGIFGRAWMLEASLAPKDVATVVVGDCQRERPRHVVEKYLSQFSSPLCDSRI